MKKRGQKHYYRAVPGSRELVTSSAESDRSLLAIEGDYEGGGLAPLIEYNGDWLGGVELGAGAVVPHSVFDTLAPEQTPLEQAVYLHLFRLSYGEGRNFIRVGKRELTRRARVSDRRLNVALDGLVEKGHVKPLHRSVAGTLYRVYLPSEVLDTSPEPGLKTGERKEIEPESADEPDRPVPARGTAPQKGKSKAMGPRRRPLESPLNEEAFADVSGRKPIGPSVNDMARGFFEMKGRKARKSDLQMAVSALTGLLEDGFTREEVNTAIEWLAKNAPDENNLDRLPYYITRALEED